MVNNFDWGLDSPYIAHYGTKRHSGRYPWGSGAKWGKTPLGRATDRIKKFFGKNRVEKSDAEREVNTSTGGTSSGEMIAAQKTKSQQSEVNTKEQKSAESHEADRKAALESGDRNQILKYFSESSNEELQRAINKAGMMDSLNKSISDSKPKTQSAEELTKAQKEEYIKSALGSGDIKQILSVASDSSVSNNDLVNALNKANTMINLNKQLNPSKVDKAIEVADKFKSILDKGLGYYNTTSNIWNTVAANYNNTQTVKNDPTKALGYMLQAPNLNQKKDEKKDGEGKKQKEKDASQDKRAQDIQNQLNGLKKSIETLSNNQKTEAPKPVSQNQPTKQASPQIKNEVKSAIQKVSNVEIDSVEKYATSLFPNDDNYTPIKSKSDNTSTSSVTKTSNKFENYLNLYDRPDDYSKNLRGINGSTYIGTSPDYHHPERPTYTQELTSSKSNESFYQSMIYDKPISSITYNYFDWD